MFLFIVILALCLLCSMMTWLVVSTMHFPWQMVTSTESDLRSHVGQLRYPLAGQPITPEALRASYARQLQKTFRIYSGCLVLSACCWTTSLIALPMVLGW